MIAKSDAKTILLKNKGVCTREFHRCAAKLCARGQVLNTGDSVINYQVYSTVPDGPVLVTDSTEFVFFS